MLNVHVQTGFKKMFTSFKKLLTFKIGNNFNCLTEQRNKMVLGYQYDT